MTEKTTYQIQNLTKEEFDFIEKRIVSGFKSIEVQTKKEVAQKSVLVFMMLVGIAVSILLNVEGYDLKDKSLIILSYSIMFFLGIGLGIAIFMPLTDPNNKYIKSLLKEKLEAAKQSNEK